MVRDLLQKSVTKGGPAQVQERVVLLHSIRVVNHRKTFFSLDFFGTCPCFQDQYMHIYDSGTNNIFYRLCAVLLALVLSLVFEFACLLPKVMYSKQRIVILAKGSLAPDHSPTHH
jgi:hypothetical protein